MPVLISSGDFMSRIIMAYVSCTNTRIIVTDFSRVFMHYLATVRIGEIRFIDSARKPSTVDSCAINFSYTTPVCSSIPECAAGTLFFMLKAREREYYTPECLNYWGDEVNEKVSLLFTFLISRFSKLTRLGMEKLSFYGASFS